MKKNRVGITLFVLVLMIGASGYAEEAPQKVIDLANSTLAQYGKDPVIVEAVAAQNAKGISLAEIKKKDKTWMDTPGLADFMTALINSSCGNHLKKIQNSKPYFAEIFVMDNQGANVAMTDKTSDYWQGDEAKFQRSFNNGAGSVFVDEVEFDVSTQAYLVQVSIPVMDKGKAIGAITFGIDVEQVK